MVPVMVLEYGHRRMLMLVVVLVKIWSMVMDHSSHGLFVVVPVMVLEMGYRRMLMLVVVPVKIWSMMMVQVLMVVPVVEKCKTLSGLDH